MILLLLLTSIAFTVAIRPQYDIPKGPYCGLPLGSRPDHCCISRNDDCSVPMYGTKCYCDEFCLRRDSEDCCPDFWGVCAPDATTTTETADDPTTYPPQPTAPPEQIKRCFYKGKYYEFQVCIKINCNNCECKESMTRPGAFDMVCESSLCLIDTDLMTEINTAHSSLHWRADNHSVFWGRTLQDGIQLRLGTLSPRKIFCRSYRPVKWYNMSSPPESFDARTKWPGRVSGVQDQGWCGSSWALSTVQVASDRLALMSQGAEQVELSAQQLLECNSRGQQACHGGHLDRAWLYIRKYGLVEERCYPYISGTTEKRGKCRVSKSVNSLVAALQCSSKSKNKIVPKTALYRTSPVYFVHSETDIMQEIMESGPVQATISVYRDFFMYREGVYHPSPSVLSRTEGYHSIRLLGWGQHTTDKCTTVKYWLAANSWGPDWGEEGYFRIRRGMNDCEVEEYVLAAWAQTREKVKTKQKVSPSIDNSILY